MLSPTTIIKKFEKYFLSSDLEGMLSLYDDNAVYYFPPSEIQAFGRQEIYQAWKDWFEQYQPKKIKLSICCVNEPYDGYAIIYSKGESVVYDRYNCETIKTSLRPIDTVKFENGQWRYIVDFG